MKKVKIFTLNSLFRRNNYFIVIPMFILVVFGCVMVYSASFYSAGLTYDNEYFFLTKQIIGAILGTIAFIVFSVTDYKVIKKVALPLFIFSIVLLVAVFIPGIGFSNYGATRWINLGLFTFQPSEIAKFAFVIFCSSYLSQNLEKRSSFKKILPILLSGGITCLLIILFYYSRYYTIVALN